MVGLPGEPGDYDAWERDYGCTGWSWADVSPWFARVPIPLRTATPAETGPLARALLSSEETAEPAQLTRFADGRRASVNDVSLEPARTRPNLEVRGGVLVDRVLLNGRQAVGVLLADGTEIEAGSVFVCAGAIHSPAILLRSEIDRTAVGHGLQDHPSFPLALRLHEPPTEPSQRVAITALARASHAILHDLQLLAMDVVDLADPTLGLLMGAAMKVYSRGSIRLTSSDPYSDPMVDFAMLSDERDLATLRAAAEMAQRVATSEAVSAVASPLPYDLSDDGLRSSVGDYVHAVGTCRMGAVDDDAAVVDTACRVIGYEGLLVCDASVMPTVPRANTHLPTVMIAERTAARWSGRS
jgi:choline dehydrogenase-like flavoprotein